MAVRTVGLAPKGIWPPHRIVIVPVRRSRSGFVLIASCIALMLLLGFAVVAIDIERMRVIKSELQAFTDAAALNAALQLDGSQNSLVRARTAAVQLASGPAAMKWDMGSEPITLITTSFAKEDPSLGRAAWSVNPEDVSGFRFVRVQASAPAPVIFLRVFQPVAGSSGISAASVATSSPPNARLVQ